MRPSRRAVEWWGVRVTEVVLAPPATPGVAKTVNVTAKAGLVLLLVLALLYPDLGNLRDKGAGVRAVGYPLASFAVPFIWWTWWRERIGVPVDPRPARHDHLLHRHARQPDGPLRHGRVVRRLDALHEHRPAGRRVHPAHPAPRQRPRAGWSSGPWPSGRRPRSPGSWRSTSPSSASRPSASSPTPTPSATSPSGCSVPSSPPCSCSGRGARAGCWTRSRRGRPPPPPHPARSGPPPPARPSLEPGGRAPSPGPPGPEPPRNLSPAPALPPPPPLGAHLTTISRPPLA